MQSSSNEVFRVCPHQIWLAFSWREENITSREDRDTWEEMVMWRQRWEWCCHKLRDTWGHQEVEGAKNDPPLEAWQEHGLANTLILDIYLPPFWDSKLLFSATRSMFLCYSNPRKLMTYSSWTSRSHPLFILDSSLYLLKHWGRVWGINIPRPKGKEGRERSSHHQKEGLFEPQKEYLESNVPSPKTCT